ncbi:MAG: hypothetical protein K2Q23_09720, partial [Bryobacteraceae bacterium]|nr:hypothetical protein [Bryobacteraceae bacterium]
PGWLRYGVGAFWVGGRTGAGHGGGNIKGGRHLRATKGTPMTNLFLSMLDLSGVRVEKFGDSNGKLELLSDLV